MKIWTKWNFSRWLFMKVLGSGRIYHIWRYMDIYDFKKSDIFHFVELKQRKQKENFAKRDEIK